MVNGYPVYPLYIPKQFMKNTNTETKPDKVGTTEAAFLLNIAMCAGIFTYYRSRTLRSIVVAV